MKRIIWHWTGGAQGMNDLEEDSYHEIFQPDGSWESGVDVSANVPPLIHGVYAAHTLNCNSNSIGLSLDAMAGAIEQPFTAGKNPVTWAAVHGMIRRSAFYCRKFSIPVSRTTTLSHAEVQRSLKIKQRNKWDITWLPDMPKPGDSIEVGDRLRAMLQDAL